METKRIIERGDSEAFSGLCGDGKEERLQLANASLAALRVCAQCGIQPAVRLYDRLYGAGLQSHWEAAPEENELTIEEYMMLEGRYRTTDSALRRALGERMDIGTVVDIASGWSPMGLGIAAEFPVKYMETHTDARLLELKERFCNDIEGQTRTLKAGTHAFRMLDPARLQGIADVESELPGGKPIILIHS